MAGSASGPQLAPSRPTEGDITISQQVQAASLKTSFLVAFQICLFQSFDIHLFFIAQPWYFYNKFTFLR